MGEDLDKVIGAGGGFVGAKFNNLMSNVTCPILPRELELFTSILAGTHRDFEELKPADKKLIKELVEAKLAECKKPIGYLPEPNPSKPIVGAIAGALCNNLDPLIARLGDEDFDKRETATEQIAALISLAAGYGNLRSLCCIADKLSRTAESTRIDPEIKRRASQLFNRFSGEFVNCALCAKKPDKKPGK